MDFAVPDWAENIANVWVEWGVFIGIIVSTALLVNKKQVERTALSARSNKVQVCLKIARPDKSVILITKLRFRNEYKISVRYRKFAGILLRN